MLKNEILEGGLRKKVTYLRTEIVGYLVMLKYLVMLVYMVML
jgi:hypothetical protein